MTEDQDLQTRVRLLEERVEALQQTVGQLSARPVFSPVVRAVAAPAPKRDLEAHVGTYWLSRVGIIALITGFALLITYRFGDLGVFARLAAGYLLAGGLAGLGWWIARTHAVFGQILFGGGLAVAYFVTYALHFVPSVRVIDNEYLAVGLLALNIVGIVAAAQRLQSETVAGIALFLGLHTSMISDTSVLTLLTTSLLAVGGLYFLVRNRWVIVPLSTLVAVYSSHVLWARQEAASVDGVASQHLVISLGFLSIYFVLFTIATLVHPATLSARAALSFAWLNWFGFVALGAFEVNRHAPDRLFAFLLVTTGALLGAGAVAHVRRAPVAIVQTYLINATVTLALALAVQLDGDRLTLAWLVLGVVAVGGGMVLREALLRAVGLFLVALALGAHVQSGRDELLILLSFVLGTVAAERLHSRVTTEGENAKWLAVLATAEVAAAVMLLTARLLPENLTTLSWVLAAFALVGLGFLFRARWYRLFGLGVVMLAVGRLFVLDFAGLPTDQRILTFVLLGVVLLTISFAYTRLRDRLSRWL